MEGKVLFLMAASPSLPPLSQIAREIGASTATISRVLNGKEGVSEKMRQEVLEALQRCGYPSKPLRGGYQTLRNRTNTIAFALSANIKQGIDDASLFYSRYMVAFQSACADAGFYPLLIDAAQDATSTGGLKCVDESKVFGVMTESLEPERMKRLKEQVPLVLYNLATDIVGIDAVVPNVRRSVRSQLDILHGLGHRSIACFRVSPGLWQDRNYWSEFQVYGQQLGLEQPPEFFEPIGFGAHGEVEAVKVFLDRVLACSRPPTAIVTQDYYAYALMVECKARGLEVPHRMSLFGYDDGQYPSLVPLSTFRQDFYTMAREAVRILGDRVDHPELPGRVMAIDGQIIERASLAPPGR